MLTSFCAWQVVGNIYVFLVAGHEVLIIQPTHLFHFLMVWPPDHSPYPCLHIRSVGVVSRRAREAIQTYQISPSRRPPAGMSGDRTSLEIIVNWCNCRLMRKCLFLHTPPRESYSNMIVYWIDYLSLRVFNETLRMFPPVRRISPRIRLLVSFYFLIGDNYSQSHYRRHNFTCWKYSGGTNSGPYSKGKSSLHQHCWTTLQPCVIRSS